MVPWKFNPAQEKLFGVQSALLYATVRFIINSTVCCTYVPQVFTYLPWYLGRTLRFRLVFCLLGCLEVLSNLNES